MVSRQVNMDNTWAKLMEFGSHHHTHHSHLQVLKYFCLPPPPLLCYRLFYSTMLFTMLALVFFLKLGLPLNFCWFNFFFTISKIWTLEVNNQTCEAFQPSMHVNDIQVNKQGFFVILQHVFFSFFFLFPRS
jgi:hypothetical protein